MIFRRASSDHHEQLLLFGWLSNMSLKFHPYVRGILYQYFSFAPGCPGGSNPVSPVDDIAFAVPGLPVFIDVLGNDNSEGCVNGSNNIELQLDELTTYPFSALAGKFDVTDPQRSSLIYQSPCDLFEGTICQLAVRRSTGR